MAKITMVEQPDFAVLPADMVIKVKVDQSKVQDKEGRYGPYQSLSLKFLIAEVPDQSFSELIGEQIWGSVPFKLTDDADNQLRQWCEALLGFQLSPGFELDTDELVGRTCRAIVGNYEKKSGAGSGKLRHQITALLPLRAGETVPDVVAKPRADDPWATAPENPWSSATPTPPAQQQQQYIQPQPVGQPAQQPYTPSAPATPPATAPRVEEEIPF